MNPNQKQQNQNLSYRHLHKDCRETNFFIVKGVSIQSPCILDVGKKMVSHSWGEASWCHQSDLAPAMEQAQVQWPGVLAGRARIGKDDSILHKREKKKPVMGLAQYNLQKCCFIMEVSS